MALRNVLVVGGSGFIGGYVVAHLARQGYRVLVPTRRRERAKHLLTLPTVDVLEADVGDQESLLALVRGQDAVINLVGILHSRSGRPYGPDFDKAHVDLPRRLMSAARYGGAQRLIHISALKSSPDAPSEYLRSKAAGEAVVMEGRDELSVTILRPSVVFGRGDSFLSMFADLLKKAPVVPLASPKARFQPVFVEDLARLIVGSLERPQTYGKSYDVCGPRVYRLWELVKYVGELTGRPRPIISLGPGLSMLQASVLEWLPGPVMTRDNVRSMQVDNVCGRCELPFDSPMTPLESVAPSYLSDLDPRARYARFRDRARR